MVSCIKGGNTKLEEKTYIGVLTSHDDRELNESLIEILDEFCSSEDNVKILQNFHFIFTGGTFDRVFHGADDAMNKRNEGKIRTITNHTKEILLTKCGVTRLLPYKKGGVTILSYFITQRLCSIIWPLFSPAEHHLRRPENLAQWRLCDQWQVKRLTNSGSIRAWFYNEAQSDINRNKQTRPLKLILRKGNRQQTTYIFEKNTRDFSFPYYEIKKIQQGKDAGLMDIDIIDYIAKHQTPEMFPKEFARMTIALIAHDEMKERMVAFVIEHEWELVKFDTILATGTTGREVSAISPAIAEKVYGYHSGPKGGDIEIATEILFGQCHIVIFFVDPLHPHPHIDDIRTVFESCMLQKGVIIITNETHCREFMKEVVRGKTELRLQAV